MNFEWTKEQLEVKDRLDLLLKEIREEVLALEKADLNENRAILTRCIKAFSKTGYCDLSFGNGSFGQALALTAAQEGLAEKFGSLFVATEASVRLFGGLISPAGENKSLFDRIRSGEAIGAVAFTGNKDNCARTGGDGFIVNGSWDLVANGPIADVLAVVADCNDQWNVFLVRPGDAGVAVGPRLETLGFAGLAVSALELKDATVSRQNHLGPFNLDWYTTTQDMILAQASIGIARRVLETATQFAKSHRTNGKPIIRYQEIGFKLAEMYALLQTMEWYARRAAWMISEKDPETATLVHCSKVFTSETCEKIASWGMQVMAGAGYVAGNEAERGYRDAKLAPLAGTSNEIARMKIANDLLTRYQV